MNEQNQTREVMIKDLDTTQLKAIAYEFYVSINNQQQQLMAINAEIMERSKQAVRGEQPIIMPELKK